MVQSFNNRSFVTKEIGGCTSISTWQKLPSCHLKKSIREIVGKEITFEVVFNPTPQKYQMIPLLSHTLDTNPLAKRNWERLIPSRQKEILRYFSSLISDEAKERNLKKLMEVLTEKEVRFMGRSWKNGS